MRLNHYHTVADGGLGQRNTRFYEHYREWGNVLQVWG